MLTTNILSQIGLSENEITLYTALLRRGKLGYSELAKETKLNRSSVYPVSKRLIEAGLIAEDTSSPVAMLVALPPKNLSLMVEREKAAVEHKEALAKEAIANLQGLAEAATYPLPQTIMVTAERVTQYLHESTKRWNTDIKATDGIWWGYQDPSFVEHYGEWIKWYWKQSSSKGVLSHIITHETKAERELEAAVPKDRHIQIMENMTFTGTQWANGHSIILINTSTEKHYLTEIIDPVLAANTREIFRKLWEK